MLRSETIGRSAQETRIMISCRLHIVLTLLLVSCVLEAAEPSRLRAVTSGQGVEILDGNTPVLFFQQAPKAFEGRFERAGYVHPLYDLDGRVISEDFPDDHRHHRGIFWAWHQLIVGGVQIGDPWICQQVGHLISQLPSVRQWSGTLRNGWTTVESENLLFWKKQSFE